MIFEEKYFSYYILLPDQISLSQCLYFVRYWAVYVLQFLTRLWRYKFWNKTYFFNQPVILRLLRWNKQHFSSLLKGFHQSKENLFLEGEVPDLITMRSHFLLGAVTVTYYVILNYLFEVLWTGSFEQSPWLWHPKFML